MKWELRCSLKMAIGNFHSKLSMKVLHTQHLLIGSTNKSRKRLGDPCQARTV